MNFQKLKFFATPILIVLFAARAAAVGEGEPIFLMLSPSARANGMGEALVAVADAELTYFNPAALGLFALDYLGAIGWSSCQLFENYALDVPLRHFYANLGLDSRKFDPRQSFNAAVAVQYRSQMIDYGETEGRDENNMPSGTFHSYEYNRAMLFAFGFEYGVEIGLGGSVGFLRSHLAPRPPGGAEIPDGDRTGRSFDMGAQLRVPLRKVTQKFWHWDALEAMSPLALEISPSIGWARLNMGEGLGGSKPLPECDRYGAAVALELTYQDVHLVDLLWTRSLTDHAVAENHAGEAFEEKGWGVEIMLADMFSYRFGEYSTNTPEINRKTFGITAQTIGLTKALYEFRLKERNSIPPILQYLFTHCSMSFSTSWWETSNQILEERDWAEIKLIF
ncbi:MAG TPA: hypothetical protein VF398_09370 [bacterium]|jgi:hypothetical protein